MDNTLSFEGKDIFYRTVGEGPTVVLIHGFGEDGNVWDNQADFFKNKFRLIIPDLPGSGHSPMIDDMSMEGLAEVIKKIIDKESGGEKYIAIGHSMGGYILLALAEKYGEQLAAFSLFHSSAFADTEEKKQAREKGIEFIQSNGAFEFLKTATPKLFSPITIEKEPSMIDKQVAACENFTDAALIAYYEAMMARPDRTKVLRSATVPVLFIMGKYDTAVPMEDGLKQSHLPAISHIHVLQESGHMGMMEEAQKANHLLMEFLDGSNGLNTGA